jgi:hypothetical protein
MSVDRDCLWCRFNDYGRVCKYYNEWDWHKTLLPVKENDVQRVVDRAVRKFDLAIDKSA